MKRRTHHGFTLVQLLVALGLFSIIGTALLNFFLNTTKASNQLNTVSAMQQDLTVAQQILTNRLKAAWYIPPASTTITLNGAPLARNLTGGASWTVGTNPFIAATLFPVTPGAICTPAAVPPVTDGCYRFVAYYPVLRSTWTANTTGSQNPGPDSDTASWVLAEYMSYYSSMPTLANAMNVTGNTTATTINLLADNVSPVTTAPTYTMFTPQSLTVASVPSNFSAGWPATYTNGVGVQLRAQKLASGKIMLAPGSTPLSTTVFPENIGVNGW